MTLIDYRPTRLTIDLTAIQHNIQQIKKHLTHNLAVWAVVKDNGYGHGMLPVAKAAATAGATGFCTATFNEALQLRASGFTQPILVLTAQLPTVAPIAAAKHITLSLDSSEWLTAAQPLLSTTKQPLTVQYALDTGMGRVGFQSTEQLTQAAQIIASAPHHFQATGAFTHFTSADLPASDQRYQRQLTQFEHLIQALPEQPALLHLANSAAALWHPEVPGKIVRLGLAMYGLSPADGQMPVPIPLQPALSLHSRLVSVRQLQPGDSVSYGETYRAERPQWVGTIPLGYGDGYPREMTGFHVLVQGQPCEIIGRVCMDQLVVKLPQKLPLGTLVTVIGQDGQCQITVQDIANHCHTNQNQILVRLNERLDRQYC